MNQEREAGKGTQSPGEEPVTLDRELPRMPSRSRTDEAAGEEEPGGPRMAATGELGGKGQREGGRSRDPHDESREQRADARAPRVDHQRPMRKHDVGELEIELYRVEDPPAEDVGPEPLGEQFPDRVARVSGRPKTR